MAYVPFGDKGYGYGGDIEGGLYPGISATDNVLRWGFVRKVYGVLSCQLGLTAIIAAVIMFNRPVQLFFLTSVWLQVLLILSTLVLLIPLHIYRNSHPTNLVLLGAWTAVMSITVGMACSFYQPLIVLEAVALTAGVVTGLTAYAFHATKRGAEFGWMGPMLFASLWALIIWSFIQLFFSPGPVARTIFALLGAILFSAYIVFDTWLIIARFDLDDWVPATITIYLDVINLFLYILRLLGESQRNN